MLAKAHMDPDVLYVEPGQLQVSTEPCRIRTILGSCVAVCLFDPDLHHGGLNHFMLPSAPSKHETSTRYGDRAMRTLVERIERVGSDPRRLCASVYGGARVLFGETEFMHLGRQNVEFAMKWLTNAGITIVATSVGGIRARRIEFNATTGICSERILGGV